MSDADHLAGEAPYPREGPPPEGCNGDPWCSGEVDVGPTVLLDAPNFYPEPAGACDSVWPNTLRFDKEYDYIEGRRTGAQHIVEHHISMTKYVELSKFVFQDNVWGDMEKLRWVKALARHMFAQGKSQAYQQDNGNWVIIWGAPRRMWDFAGRLYAGIGIDANRYRMMTNVVTLILARDCQQVITIFPGLPAGVGPSDPRISGDPPDWWVYTG